MLLNSQQFNTGSSKNRLQLAAARYIGDKLGLDPDLISDVATIDHPTDSHSVGDADGQLVLIFRYDNHHTYCQYKPGFSSDGQGYGQAMSEVMGYF
jgi:hypothetical protein